jgi:hypothetical protein
VALGQLVQMDEERALRLTPLDGERVIVRIRPPELLIILDHFWTSPETLS